MVSTHPWASASLTGSRLPAIYGRHDRRDTLVFVALNCHGNCTFHYSLDLLWHGSDAQETCCGGSVLDSVRHWWRCEQLLMDNSNAICFYIGHSERSRKCGSAQWFSPETPPTPSSGTELTWRSTQGVAGERELRNVDPDHYLHSDEMINSLRVYNFFCN